MNENINSNIAQNSIAEIYPIIRLPRRFSYFDYKVPAGMQVKRNDLVLVRFHGRNIYGVVARVKNESNIVKLSDISSVIRDYIKEQELELCEEIASNLFQSVSSVLHLSFSNLYNNSDFCNKQEVLQAQNLNIKKLDSAVLGKSGSVFAFVDDLSGSASLVCDWMEKADKDANTLILVPHFHDLEVVSKVFSSKGLLHKKLDGSMPKNARCSVIHSWRSGKINCLVSTRIGCFYLPPKLDAVFVMRSSSQEHAQRDRNPRYDARNCAKSLAKKANALLVFTDASPSSGDLVGLDRVCEYYTKSTAKIIDLNTEARQNKFPFLSSALLDECRNVLDANKNVVLFYNLKGVANRIKCKDCGAIEQCVFCKMPVVALEQTVICPNCKKERANSSVCSVCNSADLANFGVRNKKVLAKLKDLFPDYSVEIVEKGKAPGKARITLATQYYFENYLSVFTESVGLVADLCADLGFSDVDYRSGQRTILRIREYAGIGETLGAKVILQTWMTGMVQKALHTPLELLADELQERKRFMLPPFSDEIKISSASKSKDMSAVSECEKTLREMGVDLIPCKNGFQFFIDLAKSSEICAVLRQAPDSVIIEVNPVI